jgi:hypothetical protein
LMEWGANAFAEAGHAVQIFLRGGGGVAHAEGGRPSSPDPRLRGLLTGPWGPGCQPARQERSLLRPGRIRWPGRVGG